MPAMHDPERQQKQKSEQKEQVETAQITTGCVGVDTSPCGSVNTDKGSPMMAIVPVMIKAKSSNECFSTYAFIDNGCGAVFSTVEINQHLRTKSRKTKLIIKTLNSEQMIDTHVILDDLQIGSLDGKFYTDLPTVYMKEDMPVTLEDAPTQSDLNCWNHLRQIKLPNSRDIDIPRVTMMIGINVPAVSTPVQTTSAKLGDPYAIRTPLGWLVYGLPGKLKGQPEISVNFCRVGNGTVQNGKDHLDEQLKMYMNMDFNERLSNQREMLSAEDKQFMKIMEDSVIKINGHYQVRLPLKERNVIMPNNVSQANMFAERLKHKLEKNEKLRSQYSSFMADLEQKKFSEKVPLSEINRDDGRVWYIPHHGVRHPRKPEKLRVVFNCPIAYKGTSLNNQLLQGPDMTNRLIGVLLRWRQERVAIMADIEAMFYQVRVAPEDCDMLRYLWWPQGDLTKEPEAYRMLVHLFGAVSSPSCANYALKKTATDNENKSKKEVIEAIQRDFYVDDFLKSVSTEYEGASLAHDIMQVVHEGGFVLTKWISNSRAVLSSIPDEHRVKDVKGINVQIDVLPLEHALGVQWCVETDQIKFKQKDVNQIPTRRNILSVMSSIFDPFGATSPYVLKAKMILQSLCREKIGWDEAIPAKEQREWETWLKDMPNLSEVFLNRCYKPSEFGKVINTQLHHFADASQQGYGTVTYLRLTNENDEKHCEFVCAKSRVTPLRAHTIVKLELTAATSAVRQDDLLKRELTLKVDETIFWTDSQTVLKYIANETTRYPVFVANRIAVIRDGSDVSQWRYIPTKLNPADHASRGLCAKELITKPEWLGGPDFLRQAENTWPSSNEISPDERDGNDSSEPAPGINVNAVVIEEETRPIDQLLNHYSDWTRLKRAVAWWLRLKGILQEKVSLGHVPKMEKSLTAEEMQNSEVAIIKHVQKCAFAKEIKALQTLQKHTSQNSANLEKVQNEKARTDQRQERLINKDSPLISLNPVLQKGLLKVGGRLRNAPITESAKHQVILPKNHHVSMLVIRHIHQKVGHQGQNHVLSELRQSFWIIKAGVTVRGILKRCVVCKRIQSKVGKQKMADLPTFRLQPQQPAFTYTGVDYFGPFEIKCGRTTRKRYGVLFTCLSSRAVHIEVAESMDTSSCIDALRRFMARRGCIKEIHSDNGTNFVGANREWKDAMKQWNTDKITRFAADRGVTWVFNPPTASHHGGVWERQIRTIRKILNSILNEQFLRTHQNEEQLRTLMCEVEAIINSRPLTRCSDDPHDLDVITPNSLLNLHPTVVPPPGNFTQKDQYAKGRWRQMQYLADLFWKRWTKEYLY